MITTVQIWSGKNRFNDLDFPYILYIIIFIFINLAVWSESAGQLGQPSCQTVKIARSESAGQLLMIMGEMEAQKQRFLP